MQSSNQRLFILFVTGISAAGKTTLYEILKRDDNLSGIEVHDIDENGTPLVGLTPWRAFRVEELLYNAVNDFNQGNSSIICGVSFPNEIIESRYYNQKYNIHFLLLEIPYDVFKQRIDSRIKAAEANGQISESLRKENYQEFLSHTKRLIKKLNDAVTNQRNGHIVNSSDIDANKAFIRTKVIIKQIIAEV